MFNVHEEVIMTRNNTYRWVLAVICFLLFFTSCKRDNNPAEDTSYTYRAPEQVWDGWETGHAADVGVDIYPLLDMMNKYFGHSTRDVHGILIIKMGKLIFEEYFPGCDYEPGNTGYKGAYLHFNRDTLHCMHSVTKSFASTLIGIAIDKGFISGVDEKMCSFFPEYDSLKTTEKEKVTIEHLLSMTSGLKWN